VAGHDRKRNTGYSDGYCTSELLRACRRKSARKNHGKYNLSIKRYQQSAGVKLHYFRHWTPVEKELVLQIPRIYTERELALALSRSIRAVQNFRKAEREKVNQVRPS
jgi:hypothetical protein